MNSVSIIVPAFNEENTIIELLTKVHKETSRLTNIEFQIIVINDCSTDRTKELLENNVDLYDEKIDLITQAGKGGAVLAGLQKATGEFILFQDADLEYSPSDYAVLFRPIVEFGGDIVIGSRFIAPQWTRVHYFWNKAGNKCITFFFNVLNNTTFTDIYSCYLLYRRSLIPPSMIRTTGWNQHGEILSLAVKRSTVFYEVPITYNGRTYREGKKIRGRHIFLIIYTLLVSRFRKIGQ